MTTALVGKHAAGRTPDGLVTAFAGDLASDLPTRILPVIGVEESAPTERLWLPVLDEVEAIVHGTADGRSAESVDEDPERRDSERATASRVAVEHGHTPPLTYHQLGEVLAALKRLGT